MLIPHPQRPYLPTHLLLLVENLDRAPDSNGSHHSIKHRHNLPHLPSTHSTCWQTHPCSTHLFPLPHLHPLPPFSPPTPPRGATISDRRVTQHWTMREFPPWSYLRWTLPPLYPQGGHTGGGHLSPHQSITPSREVVGGPRVADPRGCGCPSRWRRSSCCERSRLQ